MRFDQFVYLLYSVRTGDFEDADKLMQSSLWRGGEREVSGGASSRD
jgi:hypothetical protein